MAISVDISRSGPLLVGDPAGRVDELAAARVAEGGRVYRDAARQRAPRRSGELAASIEMEGTGKEVMIQARARHAEYVEYGTSRMAPRVFFYAADIQRDAEKVLEKLPEDIARELG